MKPIVIKPPTFCKECNSNSIDIFSCYNSPSGYYDIIKYSTNKAQVLSELNSRKHLSYMKCTKCGKTYRIDWENGLPRPLYDDRIENDIKEGTIFRNN